MRKMTLFCLSGWFLVWAYAGLTASAFAQEINFSQKYERGKLFLRQKLYVDAVRELYAAVYKTEKGQKHFGALYYLSVAYYRVGDITRAMQVLNLADKLITNPRQRESYNLQLQQIRTLFGQLRIVPEVDPEEAGRLRVVLEAKSPFSHEQKRRTYRIIKRRWLEKGIALSGKSFYLPKGEYLISIALPQCLRYGFALGGAIMREVTIGDQAFALSLKEKVSCQCPGGQEVKKEGNKLSCACPNNTVWSQKNQRCEIPKLVDNRSWIARNWPWVTIVGIGVVAAAVIIPITVVTLQNAEKDVILHGETPDSFPRIFK